VETGREGVLTDGTGLVATFAVWEGRTMTVATWSTEDLALIVGLAAGSKGMGEAGSAAQATIVLGGPDLEAWERPRRAHGQSWKRCSS
jgi:hypothetical protein